MNFNVIKSVLYLHLCICPTDAKLLFKAKVLAMLTVTEKRNKMWTHAEEASLSFMEAPSLFLSWMQDSSAGKLPSAELDPRSRIAEAVRTQIDL